MAEKIIWATVRWREGLPKNSFLKNDKYWITSVALAWENESQVWGYWEHYLAKKRMSFFLSDCYWVWFWKNLPLEPVSALTCSYFYPHRVAQWIFIPVNQLNTKFFHNWNLPLEQVNPEDKKNIPGVSLDYLPCLCHPFYKFSTWIFITGSDSYNMTILLLTSVLRQCQL